MSMNLVSDAHEERAGFKLKLVCHQAEVLKQFKEIMDLLSDKVHLELWHKRK